MKKRVLATILCVAMALSLMACGNTGDQGKDDKKPAQMKYSKQTIYDTKTGELRQETETKYDQNGRETYKKTTLYSSIPEQSEPSSLEYQYNWVVDGNKATADTGKGLVVTCIYDEDGNLIERTEASVGTKTVAEYTYENGKKTVVKNTTYQGDTVYMIRENFYDTYGNAYKNVTTIPSTNTTYTTEYDIEYDEKGVPVAFRVTTDGQTTEKISITYGYDANGHVSKVEIVGMSRNEYVRDANGNILEAKSYNGDVVQSHVIYEYYGN